MPHSTAEREQVVDTSKCYGDWRDDLRRDGYVVIKNVIAEERCRYYIEQMFNWVEKFPFGFKKEDRSTWTPEHLPTHMKGGMYHGYRVQHERFMWEARQEPMVLEAFAKVWGTKELLASFDGMNFTLPSGTQLPPTEPWPHIDQSPRRKGLQCVQGILNFAFNGPDDGGLLVMKGSHNIMQDFFKSFPDVIDRPTWGPSDWFGFLQNELTWFEERGCELLKICAGAGDLVLWDSRTMHFNQVPKSQNLRALIYACYTPVSFATPEDLKIKGKLFDQRVGTTHWPHTHLYTDVERKLRFGKKDVAERDRPFEEPEESDTVLKLVGKLSY